MSCNCMKMVKEEFIQRFTSDFGTAPTRVEINGEIYDQVSKVMRYLLVMESDYYVLKPDSKWERGKFTMVKPFTYCPFCGRKLVEDDESQVETPLKPLLGSPADAPVDNSPRSPVDTPVDDSPNLTQ